MRESKIVLFTALLAFTVACGDKGGGDLQDGGSGSDGGGGGLIEVTIDRPATGSSFAPGDTITFIGSGLDTRTSTAVPNANLVWSSDLAGQIGIGPQVRTALPEGAHVITLTASADDGTSGSATIDVSVAVPPLEVTIRNPNDRDIFPSGQTIDFDCRVRLGGNLLATAEVTWSSDVSGQIGIGPQITTAVVDGTHLISCNATDPATGDTGSDSIRITVGEPAIRINNPGNGSTHTFGDTITFDANTITSDPAATVTWTSDVDGQIGVGPTVTTQLATAGTHVIRATLSALVGGLPATATDQITLDYVRANQPPNVTITDPAADGTTISAGTDLTFTGTAIDPEDGDITATATWTDVATGQTGSGGSFTLTGVSAGKIEVELVAFDANGARGRDTRVVYVDPAGGGPLITTSQPTGGPVNDATTDPAGRGDWAVTDQTLTFTATDGTVTTYNRADLGLATGGGGGGPLNAIATASGTTNGTLIVIGSDSGLSICSGPADALTCTAYDTQISQDLGTNNVDAVAIEGDIVVAATNNGIFVVDTATGNTSTFDGGDWNGSDNVNDVAAEAGAGFWLATDSGLVFYDHVNGTFDRIPNDGLPETQLDAVTIGPDGSLWVAFDGGIARLDGSPGTYQWTAFGEAEGLTEPAVNDIVVDANGVVWGATDGGGAFRFDPAVGTFLMITTADGLPSNVVNSVTIAPGGEKVFGTDQGVAVWYGE
ncbi:MAG: hypothetical protein P1V51_06675 [Deltaproteobacteria bacterium]|nr:hypothetical protein [Deltaproteobacteria bacterium]